MTDQNFRELAETIVREAQSKKLTIATAESCTGGWIGKILTDVSGSSAVYKGSIVAYANEIKENLLGVSRSTLVEHGAVSAQTAKEMVKNCAQCFGVDLALSVTGIAGPGGGTSEKPVGLVYIGLYFKGNVKTEEFRFADNGRDGVRLQAATKGLEMIRGALG